MTSDELRRRIAFYQDLGIKDLYRRAPAVAVTSTFGVTVSGDETPGALRSPSSPRNIAAEKVPGQTAVPPVVAAPIQYTGPSEPSRLPSELDIMLPPLAPADDSFAKIIEDIGDCRRCRLSEKRNKIVFGSGSAEAKLVFVGEGPGADEDAQGLPFVGRAGQLLTQMIDNTASKEGIPIRRPDVYICNVVKCRPPENRAPLPDEMEICGQFLFRQLMTIKPKAICALGSTAAKALLATKDGVTRLRGKWHKWRDIPVIVTYHPSYLLRPYNQDAKREAWEDLKKVLHYVYD
jgi:uracil-DNA glycosylase family 4